MELNEFVNLILLPFGGVSVVLIGLAAFLGNVNTKRIINGDLAKHKLKFEAFQSGIKGVRVNLENKRGQSQFK
jgi:hypothetical protein